jgi:type IX secretion system PorP/SprF family membrane protein
MNKKILSFVIVTAAWSAQLNAQQDRHFSMWNEQPSAINAGATAVMDEDIRLVTNFRMQWLSLTGEAFRTNSFGVDAKLFKNGNNHLGIGVNFINDATGDMRLTSNIVSVPINYTLEADKNLLFSIGVAPGFFQQSIKNSNMTWNNQWNGINYDVTQNSGEGFSPDNAVSSFDIGAGLNVKYNFDSYSFLNIGLSVNHITAPQVNYSTGMVNNLYRNVNIMASGTKFYDDRNFGISPQVLLQFMGPSRNILIGTYFDHEMFESSKRTDYVQRSFISYGVFARLNDALIASMAYKFNGIKIGASYEFNLSKLSEATRTVGGFELFLKYSTMTDRKAYIHDRKLFRWNRNRGGKRM